MDLVTYDAAKGVTQKVYMDGKLVSQQTDSMANKSTSEMQVANVKGQRPKPGSALPTSTPATSAIWARVEPSMATVRQNAKLNDLTLCSG